MKTNLLCKPAPRLWTMLAVALPLAAQIQPPRYVVTDLVPAHIPFSQDEIPGINILVSYRVWQLTADGATHAFVAYEGMITHIGKPGLGGPNSAAAA